MVDIHGPLKTRGETRCPGGVSVSCLASRTRHECPRQTKVYIWRLDTGCGPTLYRKCHNHNASGKRHNNTWVEPLAGNCTTSSTRQREQVWQKCRIQKNWCTVTVAPTIEHHGGHSRTPANQRWDQVPGGESASPAWLAAPAMNARDKRKCIYGGLTLDVDRHYIGSVTATTHQERGIITLESNSSQGTVLDLARKWASIWHWPQI